jgi:esterase/lipase
MSKSPHFTTFLLVVLLGCHSFTFGQSNSQPFDFEFENNTLKGFIDTPTEKTSKAVVLLIPGYGRTNFSEGRTYSQLRKKFTEYGLTVVVWDKMGCGKSEGIFDANQPVDNSAKEALEAIKKLKKLNIQGSDKIGLWGLSRAGWICPLINDLYPVDFWISVSGPTDKENYGYLMKSNLAIEGKTEQEAEKLFQSWKQYQKLFFTGGSYEAYLEAKRPLAKDSLAAKLFGFKDVAEITEEGRKKYKEQQKLYMNTDEGYFDLESGLWVYIKSFDRLLSKVNCPVLAIYGEGDSQVDWRASKQLYKDVYQDKGNLTIQTFKNCNHILRKCKTCGWREDLSKFEWAFCDGYFETMEQWLRTQKFIE